MKKYFLIFTISTCFSISHAMAQSQVETGKGQATAVAPDSLRGSGNDSRGTITKAGKNQQSVYTPPANAASNTPSSGTPASPAKGQPATVDPKKQY